MPLAHSLYTSPFPIYRSRLAWCPGGSVRGSQVACRCRSHGTVHHCGARSVVFGVEIWDRSYLGLSFRGGWLGRNTYRPVFAPLNRLIDRFSEVLPMPGFDSTPRPLTPVSPVHSPPSPHPIGLASAATTCTPADAVGAPPQLWTGYYATEDGILPLVTLPSPCPIRVTVTVRYVCLHVGPRDWQWDRATGDLIGAGTIVHRPDPPSPPGTVPHPPVPDSPIDDPASP